MIAIAPTLHVDLQPQLAIVVPVILSAPALFAAGHGSRTCSTESPPDPLQRLSPTILRI